MEGVGGQWGGVGAGHGGGCCSQAAPQATETDLVAGVGGWEQVRPTRAAWPGMPPHVARKPRLRPPAASPLALPLPAQSLSSHPPKASPATRHSHTSPRSHRTHSHSHSHCTPSNSRCTALHSLQPRLLGVKSSIGPGPRIHCHHLQPAATSGHIASRSSAAVAAAAAAAAGGGGAASACGDVSAAASLTHQRQAVPLGQLAQHLQLLGVGGREGGRVGVGGVRHC